MLYKKIVLQFYKILTLCTFSVINFWSKIKNITFYLGAGTDLGPTGRTLCGGQRCSPALHMRPRHSFIWGRGPDPIPEKHFFCNSIFKHRRWKKPPELIVPNSASIFYESGLSWSENWQVERSVTSSYKVNSVLISCMHSWSYRFVTRRTGEQNRCSRFQWWLNFWRQRLITMGS